MTNSTARQLHEATLLSLCSDAMGFQRLEYNPLIPLSVNAILSLFALFGNILILIALRKASSLHPPSKLLFRCLSTTDLCVALISQPLCIAYQATLASKNWSSVCGITEGLSHTSNAVMCGESITTLTAISVDRLLALMLGIRYRQVVTLRRVRLLVAYSWIQSLTFPLTYLWDKRVFFIWGSAWIFFCLIISTCCYLKIYMILRRQQAQVEDQNQGHRPDASRVNMGRYKKTVTSAMWIHSALLICYLPYTIATVVTTFHGSLSNNVYSAAGILVFFNSTLNPFLYCWKIREVRQTAKKTIRNICCCCCSQ